MAAIHVIYDPRNKLSVPHTPESFGVSIAVLQIPDELTDDQIKETARQLAEMVLNASAPVPQGDTLDFSTGTPDATLPLKEGHPIWQAIDRACLDDFGRRIVDPIGVIRELDKAGYTIVPIT